MHSSDCNGVKWHLFPFLIWERRTLERTSVDRFASTGMSKDYDLTGVISHGIISYSYSSVYATSLLFDVIVRLK